MNLGLVRVSERLVWVWVRYTYDRVGVSLQWIYGIIRKGFGFGFD